MSKMLDNYLKKAEECIKKAEESTSKTSAEIRQTQNLISVNQEEMQEALNQNNLDDYMAAEARVRFHKKHLRRLCASERTKTKDPRAAVPLDLQNKINAAMCDLIREATEELSRVLAEYEKKWAVVEDYNSRSRNCVELMNLISIDDADPAQIVGWFREKTYNNPEGPIAKYSKKRECDFDNMLLFVNRIR